MRLLIALGLALLVVDTWAQRSSSFPFAPLVPLAPIAVFPERGGFQGRITSPAIPSSIRQSAFSGDACSTSPCGPNTRCEVNRRGIALCRCLDDFVPDGNTINGCKPQCVNDNDCPDDYRCRASKCVRVCVTGACGLHADCDARNHRAVCRCPDNYNGDPYQQCKRIETQVQFDPVSRLPPDPCSPNPCGTNADCRTRGEQPVCTCPIGHEGNPLISCRRGECIEANDCPDHLTCQRLRCINPCQEVNCGIEADCTVKSHQPICSCPRGLGGDPFVRCRKLDPCEPSPCGRNTNCKINRNNDQQAVCSCISNYIGDPLTGCRPECERDTDCNRNMACRNDICINPCTNACGTDAFCEVTNHRAVCQCPQYYEGDPYSRCFAECTKHDDCRSYQACYQLKCIDPCEGSCGIGANCKVEDHKAICSCPKDFTGHPFDRCKPFTPEDLCFPNPCGSQANCEPGFDSSGNDRPVCTCPRGYIGNPLVACQRGECQSNEDCRSHEACYNYMCENPCYFNQRSVCGESAVCNVKNHQPVCSCPPGYDGNPLTECRIRRSGPGFSIGHGL
ncbi:hypothetical protein SK128_009294 [Halocaridina rubra]|uniref:EGF-like domain-containing protein n=1 Tax=Halocaridina rubra TaxID=373956 RepID=A0AAN8WHX2_HALRR